MLEFPRRNGRWGGREGVAADRRRGWDFIYTKISARPRSGFYLHKECRAGEIGILSTQRISRGRGSDVDLQKRCTGCCLNDNVLRRISAIVNTIFALRAFVLQKLVGNNGCILAERQSSTIDGA